MFKRRHHSISLLLFGRLEADQFKAEFVSYNDQALPPVHLPSIYLTSSHVTKVPGLPLCFCILQTIQNWRQEWRHFVMALFCYLRPIVDGAASHVSLNTEVLHLFLAEP